MLCYVIGIDNSDIRCLELLWINVTLVGIGDLSAVKAFQ